MQTSRQWVTTCSFESPVDPTLAAAFIVPCSAGDGMPVPHYRGENLVCRRNLEGFDRAVFRIPIENVPVIIISKRHGGCRGTAAVASGKSSVHRFPQRGFAVCLPVGLRHLYCAAVRVQTVVKANTFWTSVRESTPAVSRRHCAVWRLPSGKASL